MCQSYIQHKAISNTEQKIKLILQRKDLLKTISTCTYTPHQMMANMYHTFKRDQLNSVVFLYYNVPQEVNQVHVFNLLTLKINLNQP